jgi:hypothetical protein
MLPKLEVSRTEFLLPWRRVILPKLEVMHHADVLTDASEYGKLANVGRQ